MGIPQIVAPGCMEYWHWSGPAETIPAWRKMHFHNPLVLCCKATHEEMVVGAKRMAEKLNRAQGPVVILYPHKGFDEFDRPGCVFHGPEGHEVFFKTLKENINPKIKLIELNMHINDQAFAEKVIAVFDAMMEELSQKKA